MELACEKYPIMAQAMEEAMAFIKAEYERQTTEYQATGNPESVEPKIRYYILSEMMKQLTETLKSEGPVDRTTLLSSAAKLWIGFPASDLIPIKLYFIKLFEVVKGTSALALENFEVLRKSFTRPDTHHQRLSSLITAKIEMIDAERYLSWLARDE